MPWYFYLILALGIIAAGVAALIIRDAILRSRGRYVHAKVTARLNRYARLRRYRVLTDVTVPYKDGEKNISHLLVGIFGILIVDAHEFSGELYGTAEDKKWTYIPKKGARQQPDSLSLDLQAKADAVRTLLAANKVYRLAIDSVNVVQNAEKGLVLYVPQSLPVIRLKRLSAMLGKSKYDKDEGVDIEKVAPHHPR